MSEVFEDPWFKEGYNPCKLNMKQEFNSLFDINVDMVLNQFDVWVGFNAIKACFSPHFYIVQPDNFPWQLM
jgi:hypothetical protein